MPNTPKLNIVDVRVMANKCAQKLLEECEVMRVSADGATDLDEHELTNILAEPLTLTLTCGKKLRMTPPEDGKLFRSMSDLIRPHLDECDICRKAWQSKARGQEGQTTLG